MLLRQIQTLQNVVQALDGASVAQGQQEEAAVRGRREADHGRAGRRQHRARAQIRAQVKEQAVGQVYVKGLGCYIIIRCNECWNGYIQVISVIHYVLWWPKKMSIFEKMTLKLRFLRHVHETWHGGSLQHVPKSYLIFSVIHFSL